MNFTIGSRGSKLALWQANWVKAELESRGHQCRIEIIQTTGDRITDVPLAKVGAKGLFTKEIEEALLEGRIDLAVHSCKDMPTDLPAGLTLAAIPVREDPRDAVIGRPLAELPAGSRIGTSSLRRHAQLALRRPDLSVSSVRGNLDTRIRKLDEGQFDAILLAAAGLRRLGWGDRISEILPVEVMCPAVGQGALAIETRDDGGPAHQACRELNHHDTSLAVAAERGLLAGMGGGCQAPLGAYATYDGSQLHLRALVLSPGGAASVPGQLSGLCATAEDAAKLGRMLAESMLDAGARAILEAVYGK